MPRVVALFLLSIAAAYAQDVPQPPKGPVAGDKTEVKIESTLELDIETKDQTTDKPGVKQLSIQRVDEFIHEVVQGAENGGRKDRVTCTSSKEQRSGTNQSLRTENTDIHGKTFELIYSDKGRTTRLQNGDPAPIDSVGIGAWDEYARLLPKGEWKEGATWGVESAGLAALMSVTDMASPAGAFELKIEKMAEGKGTITFTGTITGKTSKGASVKLNFTGGRLEVDIARLKPSLLWASGSLEMTQDIVQRIPRPGELKQTDEKIGTVTLKSRKLEVKVEYK